MGTAYGTIGSMAYTTRISSTKPKIAVTGSIGFFTSLFTTKHVSKLYFNPQTQFEGRFVINVYTHTNEHISPIELMELLLQPSLSIRSKSRFFYIYSHIHLRFMFGTTNRSVCGCPAFTVAQHVAIIRREEVW